jgi:hypothetical protein
MKAADHGPAQSRCRKASVLLPAMATWGGANAIHQKSVLGA